jgi:putative transposase
MCRVLKLEIKEQASELQELLREQKTGFGKERIQALYLLKTRQVETVQHGRGGVGSIGRITVQRWLRLYRDGGLNRLLEQKKSPGRPKTIPLDVRSLIKKELSQPEGIMRYE